MSANEKSVIVPFGKYKGQPVEVLAADRPYFEWLNKQAWFKEKFSYLTLSIVQVNTGEPTETPDHNALQVLFLDDKFCSAFFDVVFPTMKKDAEKEFEEYTMTRFEYASAALIKKQKEMDYILPLINEEQIKIAEKKASKEHAENTGTYIEFWKLKDLLDKQKNIAKELKEEINIHERYKNELEFNFKFFFKREFEVLMRDRRGSIDVVVAKSIGAFCKNGDYAIKYFSKQCFVELKPCLGDDYPAVLRQMKSNGSDVLFIDQYSGIGATVDQIIATFKTSNIKVVFRQEIETEMRKQDQ